MMSALTNGPDNALIDTEAMRSCIKLFRGGELTLQSWSGLARLG